MSLFRILVSILLTFKNSRLLEDLLRCYLKHNVLVLFFLLIIDSIRRLILNLRDLYLMLLDKFWLRIEYFCLRWNHKLFKVLSFHHNLWNLCTHACEILWLVGIAKINLLLFLSNIIIINFELIGVLDSWEILLLRLYRRHVMTIEWLISLILILS